MIFFQIKLVEVQILFWNAKAFPIMSIFIQIFFLKYWFRVRSQWEVYSSPNPLPKKKKA